MDNHTHKQVMYGIKVEKISKKNMKAKILALVAGVILLLQSGAPIALATSLNIKHLKLEYGTDKHPNDAIYLSLDAPLTALTTPEDSSGEIRISLIDPETEEKKELRRFVWKIGDFQQKGENRWIFEGEIPNIGFVRLVFFRLGDIWEFSIYHVTTTDDRLEKPETNLAEIFIDMTVIPARGEAEILNGNVLIGGKACDKEFGFQIWDSNGINPRRVCGGIR